MTSIFNDSQTGALTASFTQKNIYRLYIASSKSGKTHMIAIRTLLYLLLLSAFAFTQVRADTGIIVAFESTLNSLKGEMTLSDMRSIAKREFFSGNLDGSPVVLVRSPMGKVNNTITAQLLISNYEIDRVISISPSGGIGDDVEIGDMVIADRLVQHDFGTIKPYGFVAGKAPEGLNWQKENYILSNGKISRGAVAMIRIHGINKVHIGTVVSADQFIASPAKRAWLKSMHGADAADMGAAAIGQVCQANNVRLLVARIITDKAGITARTKFPAWNESYSPEFDMPGLARMLLSINAQAENR